ncbi:protein CrcB [Clostridiales bacterium oral taxon 876 str. F0540]|nr:protein CrcB [Clostridiales bacterium oral taxon 876 str. F0540]
MKKYIFIGLGGILGAISRYLVKNIHISGYKEAIPLNTFIINITGAFLLAFLLTTALEVRKIDEDIKLGIGTGFLGAYTTFSTMCKETVGLLKSGYYFSAVSYIGFSTLLGLAAAYFGVIVSREVLSKFIAVSEPAMNESTISKAEDGEE